MFTKKSISRMFSVSIVIVFMLSWIGPVQAASLPVQLTTAPDPTLPAQTVKLIFIHHSTGENWLRDDYGILGKTLGQNNYFVSDTNYGWGPDSIGDRTDIPDWPEWFRSSSTPTYMNALYAESGQNSDYTRTLTNPGGQNMIVMFKSCFPNSNLEGNPNDPPDSTPGLTVGHAKYVYNELQKYFRTRPDRLFIVITAPPVTDSTYAANARAFNNWLFNDWLSVNSYPFSNVAVFDFYNVLTHKNAHHRYDPATGNIEHIVTASNTLYYPSSPGDDHPNITGSIKATNEFLPLLNIFYNRWKAEDIPQTIGYYSAATRDGYVLESTETSNAGGTLNSTATYFVLGDNAQNKQYRAILSFDTSSLPDTAVITKATLKIKKSSVVGTDPFTTHGSLVADIRNGYFGTSALEITDFQATASKNSVGKFTPVSGAPGWYKLVLGAANYTSINLTGTTQFRLRFATDDNNDNIADYVRFLSGNYPTASARPALIIEYYVP